MSNLTLVIQDTDKGTLVGKDTTATASAYSDAQVAGLASGTIYYRRRQVDLDGPFSYSLVRSVVVATTAGLGVHLNPISAAATLTGAGAAVQVLVALGRVVATADATG